MNLYIKRLLVVSLTLTLSASTFINTNATAKFSGYKEITINSCDFSGKRQPNVVVDIGSGDREYYAFTNEYGQLVKVTAKEIIVQNDDKEKVTKQGRYCSDEANVPGVEDPNLDQGHVIADSLGGVSNAYNITPQDSYLNREGQQYDMEEKIRQNGGAKDFEAIITYPNTKTQTPSHYSFKYTMKGKTIKEEFDNGDNTKGNNDTNTSDNKTSEASKQESKKNFIMRFIDWLLNQL